MESILALGNGLVLFGGFIACCIVVIVGVYRWLTTD